MEAIKLSNISRQSPLGQPYDENGELKWYPHDDSGIGTKPISFYTKNGINSMSPKICLPPCMPT